MRCYTIKALVGDEMIPFIYIQVGGGGDGLGRGEVEVTDYGRVSGSKPTLSLQRADAMVKFT